MADEVEIAITQITLTRDNLIIYDLGKGVASEQINASGTQDDSAEYNGENELAVATITNNHTSATRIAVWDSAGTIDATNSFSLGPDKTIDTYIRRGQVISSKVV